MPLKVLVDDEIDEEGESVAASEEEMEPGDEEEGSTPQRSENESLSQVQVQQQINSSTTTEEASSQNTTNRNKSEPTVLGKHDLPEKDEKDAQAKVEVEKEGGETAAMDKQEAGTEKVDSEVSSGNGRTHRSGKDLLWLHQQNSPLYRKPLSVSLSSLSPSSSC